MYLRVSPSLSTGGAPVQTNWTMEKLGHTVDPSDVMRGGAKHMHVAQSATLQGTGSAQARYNSHPKVRTTLHDLSPAPVCSAGKMIMEGGSYFDQGCTTSSQLGERMRKKRRKEGSRDAEGKDSDRHGGNLLCRHLTLRSIDASLLCFGVPTAFPVPTTTAPDFSWGASVILWNNIW